MKSKLQPSLAETGFLPEGEQQAGRVDLADMEVLAGKQKPLLLLGEIGL